MVTYRHSLTHSTQRPSSMQLPTILPNGNDSIDEGKDSADELQDSNLNRSSSNNSLVLAPGLPSAAALASATTYSR